MKQVPIQFSTKSRRDGYLPSERGTLSRMHRAKEQFAVDTQEPRESRRRRELGEFLKARRAALRPEDFGLSALGRRRTPGLRREELAQVSGVGVTWYTWLEQGRDIRVSADLLQRLSRTLRLSPHDAVYLFSLADQESAGIQADCQPVIEGLQAVLDGYASGPAFAIDSWSNVLAFNKIADFVYHFNDYDGPWRNNHIWRFFVDPYRRQLHPDWLDLARYLVGLARGIYAGKSKDTPEYRRMLADLCKSSPDFNRMWNESRQQGTSPLAPGIQVHYRIPRFGDLAFNSVRLTVPLRDEMAIFMSPLNDTTHEAMLRLTSQKGKGRP